MSPARGGAAPSKAPLRVAVAGLGTVGCGVIALLRENAALIERRAGRPIALAAVSARDPAAERCVDTRGVPFERDAAALAARADVDAVIEVIGGAEGAALGLAEATLAAGKPLITANKAMLARHGMRLAASADARDVPLKFEAAVAGGIPVIKALREGASANRIDRVYGILNGTCNFILTRMEAAREQGVPLDFADALAEAQALGYAEADPSTDIDGHDTAHKLSILAAICFGSRVNLDAVTVRGIREVTAADIAEAHALGHRVRLIGWAEQGSAGLAQRVGPCLVPADHPLGYVPGALTAVVAEGNFVGRLFLEGAGAGAGPTASAVVADLIDVARDEYGPAFAMPVDALEALAVADPGTWVGKTYVRMIVADRVGVLAEIATAMRDAGVSVESFHQRMHGEGSALLAMVTHSGAARCIADVVARLSSSTSLLAPPMVMPILAL